MSERGTFSLSMPKSACSSAVIGAAPVLDDVGDQQHVGAVAVELEPVGDVLAQHRRRERPEGLAVLDLQVEHLLHRRRARVAEDRAAAERARAELHAALEPADGLAVGERARPCASMSSRRPSSASKRAPAAVSRCSISAWLEARAEVAAAHARRARRRCWRGWPRWMVVGGERRAERAAGVAGGRLDPDAARRRRRAAPCRWRRSSAPRRRPGRGSSRRSPGASGARHAQHDLLGDRLDRRGEVHLALRRAAPRACAAARRTARRSARSSWSGRCSSRSSSMVEPEASRRP